MDVREKFVAFLADLDCNAEYCKDCEFAKDIDGCVRRQKEIIADHLIAHGVTVQEWISVKDRLPEPFEEVLVYDHTGKSINCAYMTRHHEWVGAIMSHVVTHWMPLTQPPKGE